MKERPIIFSAPIVRSILAGQKTQTRLEAKDLIGFTATGQPVKVSSDGFPCEYICPYGRVGDRLWVVTMRPILFGNGKYAAGDDGRIYDISGIEPRRRKPAVTDKGYEEISLRASGERRNFRVNRLVAEAFYGTQPYDLPVCRHLDGDRRNNRPENLDWGTEAQNSADATAVGAWSGIKSGKRWRAEHPAPPPPNLPRWASRITLEITGIRVERLQDISEADAIAEGCDASKSEAAAEIGWHEKPRRAYRRVWESLNGAGSWDANPWVWCVQFKRMEGGAA